MCPGSLILQQLLGRQVCEEHLEDSLRIQTVPGIGVPDHTVAQERLCRWDNREKNLKKEREKGVEAECHLGGCCFLKSDSSILFEKPVCVIYLISK